MNAFITRRWREIVSASVILLAFAVTRVASQFNERYEIAAVLPPTPTPQSHGSWLQANEPMVYINGKLTAPKSAKIAAK